MSLTTTASTITYPCNGAAAFPVPFRFLAAGDLVVTRIDVAGVEELLELGVDFTVTGAGGPSGGTVTLLDPPDDGELRIDRVVALTQPLSLQSGSFSPKAIETAFDRISMMSQQAKREHDKTRAIVMEETAQGAAILARASEVAAAGSAAIAAGSESVAAGHVAAAAAQVAAAAGQADAASGSAASSDAARAAAEAARDASAAAGLVYADTTAGLAATASGGYFWVPGSPSSDVLILYKDNAGTAVEVGRLPASVRTAMMETGLHVGSRDNGNGLHYFADVGGRVFAFFDANADFWLAGLATSLQARLAQLAGFTSQVANNGDLEVATDISGNVTKRQDADGGLWLPGLSRTVQEELEVTRTAMLWRETGKVSLPAGFTPMTKTLRGGERFVYAGSRSGLRPNELYITGYPFDWTTEPVRPANVRRARAKMNRRMEWLELSLSALTVNLPGDYGVNTQFRDTSVIFDRSTAKYYLAVSTIGLTAPGWLAENFAVFSSADQLTWDFVCYVTPPDPGTKVWSPEWFVDDDGSVYVIYGDNTEGGGAHFAPHAMRCTNLTTFATWAYAGKMTGAFLPHETASGDLNCYDPYVLQRDGIYYLVTTPSGPDGTNTYPLGQIIMAWSTNLLGPYDQGIQLHDVLGDRIKGEGPTIVEMPAGFPYRWRCFFDNYLGVWYGAPPVTGRMSCCDSNDLITWTSPVPIPGLGVYNRNSPFVIGF